MFANISIQESDDSNVPLDNNNLLYYSSSKFNSYSYLTRDDSSPPTDLVVVNDENPNDTESNISLIFKQPSYLSLSEMIISKDGNIIHDSNSILNVKNEEESEDNLLLTSNNNKINKSNPVIVFDSLKCLDNSNDELSDTPIQLSVRQPSYISLGPLEFVPKGSNSLSDFHPIIKESVPNKDEPNKIEEDQTPEVQLVQKLNFKNSKRWNKIGYQPPENLIPLVRAASLHNMEINNESGNFNLSEIGTNYSHNNLLNTKLEPINEEDENSPLCKNFNKIRRSSSFGMELGEAENKSVEMMNEIMGSSSCLKNNAEGDDFADDEL